jgi:cytosine/adenosine deaminase-related metal-dependent hydrolase
VLARRLAARWLIPVEGDPIERGAILIGAGGRLEAVGPDALVPHPPGIPATALDRSAILPGFVNTHTHLELTGFAGQVQQTDFADWIRELRQLKTSRTPAQYLEAARQGLADCYANGVTTVADTGDSGATALALAEAAGSGVIYQEVFGPHPDQAEPSLSQLQKRVGELRSLVSPRLRIGVSPHAPYTVSGKLFQLVAEWARAEHLPIAVHIAESPAETQFLLAGAGPFARAWAARGIPLPSSSGMTPIQWLSTHGVLSERCLCIHAVQVEGKDISELAATRTAVAHCPLSNAAHQHGAAPLEAMLRAGIRVGLGTDSVVSVGHLDLLAEARAAGELAGLSPEGMLRLCTLDGARALNLEHDIGSLVPGKWADCVAIRLGHDSRDIARQVLESSPADVLLTLVAGKEVYRSG